MTKEFALFAKDGLKIAGRLPEDHFSPIAKEITNGYMSLFFRSSPTSIILGSCFNLKPTSGGREEGFIVIGEFTYDEFKLSSFEFFQNYFQDAIEFIMQSGYDVLDLYGEQRIKEPKFKIPQNKNNNEFAKIIGGKLLFSKSSFVYSTDFINSLSFFSYFIDNLKPVLSVGYTFVISKLIVPADLLICSNKHPDESKIDIDIDSVTSNLPDDDITHYHKLGENLPHLSANTVSINKTNIVISIAQRIKESESNQNKREEINNDWTLFLFGKYSDGNIVTLNVKTAIDQLYLGSRKYFQIYVNSNQYNLEEIQSKLRKYNFADFDQIEKALNLIIFNAPERETEVLSVFKSVKKEKTIVITKIAPIYKNIPSDDESSQPTKWRTLRVIAFVAVIILLIAALIVTIVFFNPFDLVTGQNQVLHSILNNPKTTSNPILDSCSKDPNNIDCNLPKCCLIYSSDKLAQLNIPIDGIDDSTYIKIPQKSNTHYDLSLPYKSDFQLQDDIAYKIDIQNFNPSSTSIPKLKIMARDPSNNYNRVFISKYDTEERKWSQPMYDPKIGAGATIDLKNNVNGVFGLFIENKQIANLL